MAEIDSKYTIVAHGEVVFVESESASDDAFGRRIKVRLDSDGGTATAELPWAWPLNPKIFHCVPKVGEGVLVIVSKAGAYDSQRYYIGPIISQPQFMEECDYKGGRGDAVSMLSGAKTSHEPPLPSINRAKGATKGAFPELEDVALLGRGQEDVVLKYKSGGKAGDVSEINLRAGIRLQATDRSAEYLKGNVIFNEENPAYVQVKRGSAGLAGLQPGTGDALENKHESTEVREAGSLVNIVADKINLISHKDSNQFKEKIVDRDDLIKINQMDEIMSNLHRTVYGDELITLLKLIIETIKTHTHPYIMMEPTEEGTSLADLATYPLEKILSPNVRIS